MDPWLPRSVQQRFTSDVLDAQADPSLCWAHMKNVTKCCAPGHICFFLQKLPEELQKGAIPDKPEYCPASLYKLMKECWSRDVVNRPSILDVIRRLKDM